MALKPVVLLLLWELTLFLHGVESLCNVTCSTDYEASLNCSCSGGVPTHPVVVNVMCSDERLDVNGSCVVKPPLSWCVMYPDSLYEVTSVETMCTTTVNTQQGDPASASESPRWALSYVVKAAPPDNVQVTNTDGFYKVTWDHDNHDDCLTYRVRVRESKDLSKKPAHSLLVQEKYTLFDHKMLQPHAVYTVDVQAQMCPEDLYKGPWSEWSPSSEWTTCEGIKALGWCISIPVVVSVTATVPILLLALLLLWIGFHKRTLLLKRYRRVMYIPRADEFFKPLNHKYEGNFKEWVNAVFSEYDYVNVNSHAQTAEKPHSVLQWSGEKQSYSEDNELKQGGPLLHALQPHGDSSSQGTGRSAGHVSILTVTLSGEDEFEEGVASSSSVNALRSYRDPESFGSSEGDDGGHAGYDLEEPRRQSGISPEHEHQILGNLSAENINFEPHVQLDEPERVSLDSFASNEQSEDGYPHVDLDTIDSGFGECSSPGALDTNTTEQMDSDLFHEHKSSNSYYVKQWMIRSTIQEDSEKEVHETQ